MIETGVLPERYKDYKPKRETLSNPRMLGMMGLDQKSFDAIVEHITPRIANNSNFKILILGSGSGKLADYLTDVFSEIQLTQLDISYSALERVRDLKDNLKLINADLLELPFEESSFDIVIAHGVFRYLTHNDIRKGIIEVDRVLKPNGFGLIAEGKDEKTIRLCERNSSGLNSLLVSLENIEMPRLTLLYALFENRNTDPDIRDLLSSKNEFQSLEEELFKLAGTSISTIWCFEWLRKESESTKKS